MFNKPVVVVVGAGASHDIYGLPLGGELASGIAKDTDFYFEHIVNRPVRGDADLFDEVIYSSFSHARTTLDRYTAAGHKLSAALSSTVSINDALDQLSDYPEAVDLGKICIVRSILRAERTSVLKAIGGTGEPERGAGKDGWIEQLLSMAITGFKHSEIKHAFKRITFINFNYDRCIEQYLFWSLQRLGLSVDEASETVEGLNVMRPYGTLGSILPKSQSFLGFGASAPRGVEAFNMIDRIRTFTESNRLHNKEELSRAILEASLIAFLGFGFHPQNLELLALSPHQQERRTRVMATVKGVHQANMGDLISTLQRVLRVDYRMIETHNMTASEILQDLRMKITMAVG